MATTDALRRRATPVAVCLALVSLTWLLTDTVAASQVLALAGPGALALFYPLSGVGLAIAAMAQFAAIDRRPRLTMVRVLGIGYALATLLALSLGSVAVPPVLAVAAVWLLADQISLLFPVLLWALAADVCNSAEGHRIFGWILGWSYLGQLIGLGLASAAPAFLPALGIPLPALLMVNPVVCLVLALWLPRAMRGQATSRGIPEQMGLVAALSSTVTFFRGVRLWRSILWSVTIAATAGTLALLGFSSSAEQVIGRDAGALQVYFGLTSLAILLACGLYQPLLGERVARRLGSAGQLLILPIATIAGGLIVAGGAVAGSLPLMAVGIAVIGVPTWTVDENARHSALAVIPDQLRARISLVLDLGRFALAQLVAGALAAVGFALGWYWLAGLLAAVLAAFALHAAISAWHGWDEHLLSWRLRRRKHPAAADLLWIEEESS